MDDIAPNAHLTHLTHVVTNPLTQCSNLEPPTYIVMNPLWLNLPNREAASTYKNVLLTYFVVASFTFEIASRQKCLYLFCGSGKDAYMDA